MMYFDMKYILMVMIPGLVMSGLASMLVKSSFAKWSQIGTRRGFTGAQAAKTLLDGAGIHDVQIVPTNGFLSDHYNPSTRTLALSESVYASRSVAAVGVACHEAGHAIQHANSYAPLWARSALVPAMGIGSSVGPWVIFIGLAMHMQGLAVIGCLLFGAVVLFQIVTLPVEFDASARAKRLVVEAGILDADEQTGVNRVLNAAALTYVAAAASSILTLLYFMMRAGLLGGRRDD
ncbi:MAG: zinc metallopeptidase [Planctomycetaceae bacterium]|nr:zinc metallopeptidase [Planctomycetaceae bacterium]